MNAEYLYPVELADRLRRSRTYVCAMRKAGFEMPGGTATEQSAREWLKAHPEFRVNRVYGKSKDAPAIREL